MRTPFNAAVDSMPTGFASLLHHFKHGYCQMKMRRNLLRFFSQFHRKYIVFFFGATISTNNNENLIPAKITGQHIFSAHLLRWLSYDQTKCNDTTLMCAINPIQCQN